MEENRNTIVQLMLNLNLYTFEVSPISPGPTYDFSAFYPIFSNFLPVALRPYQLRLAAKRYIRLAKTFSHNNRIFFVDSIFQPPNIIPPTSHFPPIPAPDQIKPHPDTLCIQSSIP